MITDFATTETLAPDELESRLKAMSDLGRPPFSDSSVSVVQTLSAYLLKSDISKKAPQFIALGYWLRSAAIKRLQSEFCGRLPQGHVPTSRGLAFHLPPANVDTLFVYSWVLSYLAGNANIVRLPSELSETTQWLLNTVIDVLREANDLSSNLFCQYDYRSDISKTISTFADLRMVWGGDEKVKQASIYPVRPDGLSLGFSDRKSHSVIKVDAYAALDEIGKDQLAERLYNDIYWFDQLGCGSPRAVLWVGEAGDQSKDLYQRLVHLTERKGYGVETGVAISKFAFANSMIASGMAKEGKAYSNELSVLVAEENADILSDVHGGGMLWDMELTSLDGVLKLVDRHTQTISHYGFEESELVSLASAMVGKGGFRLVPVGSALSFEETWDGIPLLDHMTRRIVVRA